MRLQTLIRLRWIAIAGQLIAVVSVYFLFGFNLPLGLCFGLIALSAWLNIFIRIRYRSGDELGPHYSAIMLHYDLLQLVGLLYLTGGLQNPFSLLLLAPVTVSASTQPAWQTLLLGSVAMVCATGLIFFNWPLPWHAESELIIPQLYLFGVWSALASGMIFIGLYAWRIAKETRQMSDALAAAELVLAHEQKLSALDGLAAAAAHKLGTPLATISVIAKELEREVPKNGDIAEDVDLLIGETQKCRDILRTLIDHDSEDDAMFARVPLSDLLEEIVQPYRALGTPIQVKVGSATDEYGSDKSLEPILERNPGVIYALGNLIENAIDFAKSTVEIFATWSHSEVEIRICDDGAGLQPAILENLGQPFVTTRKLTSDPSGSTFANMGMGLGFFIAKTLLGRVGAKISLANRTPPETGAIVTIHWPLDRASYHNETSAGLPEQNVHVE